MFPKIKTICLILITLAVLVGVGFYCWSIWKRYQEKYDICVAWCNFYSFTMDSLNKCLHSCGINPDFLEYLLPSK